MVKFYPQIGNIGDPLREMAEEEYYMDHSSGGDLIPDMGPYGILIPLSIVALCYILMFTLIHFKNNLFTRIATGIALAVLLIACTWVSIELINLMS